MDARVAQPNNNERLTNPFREALRSGKPLIGIWSMLNSINASEGLGWAGYDWLLIDGEHAPITLPDAMTHLRALAPTPTVPIVRLPWNDRILLKQFLDAGARTLMLPYVQNADEARAAVDAMHYPPRGNRGVAAMHRASRYGFEKDYLRNASDSLFLIVQAETAEALENIDMIAAVDGVDAVFFGPGDLAASMGKLGQAADADVTDAIDRAAERVRACGKAVGVLAPTADIAERHLRSGYDFVSVANEAALLFSAASTSARRFREVAGTSAAGPGV
uniref:HpcH/HpaI aldolase family protein n=1 Tax=Pararhizobium sp. IMCC3301 TaxID=3067904 RepID=UPI0027414654|nr:HpcH/HpaI aldolase/citrate lyase family protein [Pararhizobium sp. IMCC3301]